MTSASGSGPAGADRPAGCAPAAGRPQLFRTRHSCSGPGTAVPDQAQLFRTRCDTCVFRPGNRMALPAGRLAELVAANRGTGSLLICHKTTYGQHPELGETMCRGFFDAYAEDSAVAQVMTRLFGADWYIEVDPPAGR